MKVKIVKAPNHYWYGNKIGQEFEVNDKKTDFNVFYVKEGEFKERAIGVEDCELITPVKIPFSFEAWDKDRTQKVWTRDGREVKQLTWFECPDMYPLRGVFSEGISMWTKDGKFEASKPEHDKDLFLEHHEREYWVNVYRCIDDTVFANNTFTNFEEAETEGKKSPHYIKTINFKA